MFLAVDTMKRISLLSLLLIGTCFLSAVFIWKMSTPKFDPATAIYSPNVSSGLFTVLVLSSILNTKRREAIRTSWGTDVRARGGKLWFVVGYHPNCSPDDGNACEHDPQDVSSRDILRVAVEEEYPNLVFKMVEAFKSVPYKQTRYVVKVDDDVYLNMDALLHRLRNEPIATSTIRGYVFDQAESIRNRSSKWYLPESQYPSNQLPAYASGTGYVMSADVAPLIGKCADSVPLIPLEDVYITGLCREHFRIKLKQDDGFGFQERIRVTCSLRKMVIIHSVLPSEMEVIDNQLKSDIRC